MKKTIKSGLLALAFAAISAGAHAQYTFGTPDSDRAHMMLSPWEQHFIYEAYEGNMLEVALGRYAIQNASSNRVKTFGRIMVTDHMKALMWIKCMAGERRIWLPETLDPSHMATYMRLTGNTGTAFDTAYVADMKQDHQDDVNEYNEAERKAVDMDVHAYVSTVGPWVKQHLDIINDIDASMKM